jgi:conjugal transfer pilus assembly protein TrbC
MFTIKKQLILILLILSSTNALAKAQTYIFVSFSMPDAALKSYFMGLLKEEIGMV